jgi:bifunctional non-homologous end joining protein LigD
VSGKTIKQMESNKDAETWQSNRSAKKSSAARKKAATKKAASKKKEQLPEALSSPKKVKAPTDKLAASVKAKKTGKMPTDLLPMLATLVDKPVTDEGWLYEVKWDGYRALAYLKNGKVELRSRNNKSFNEKFYPLYETFSQWDMNAIIDGEIVVLKENGMADFAALQNWRSEADGQLMFYAFDILWLEGKDLMQLPLNERREILGKIIPAEGSIRLSETFNATGEEFFKLANDMGLEGIIAKKSDSLYKPDSRSKEWLKIKTEKQQEVVIGGYTINENTSKLFSALLLGVYEGKEFRFAGVVGTGFTNKLQQEIVDKLEPYKTPKCPFSEEPDLSKPSRFRPNPPKAKVVWVKPKLVAEISYRELTDDQAIRHPSFRGLREDKTPSEVKWERALPIQKIVEKKKPSAMEAKLIRSPKKAERKTLLNPSEETQTRVINGHELKFTNLSKVYWPKDGITKRDMLNYYYQVAPYMLPYMKDRPQSLNRYPNGISGKSFYQKDVTGKVPDWIELFPYHSEDDDRDKNFLVCTNEASLLYIASLGAIEMNPWSSRVQKPDHPDWCVIDLDPSAKNTFDQVIEAAKVTKKVLDEADIDCYCKTSGSTGLHIYIPLGAKYTYEQSKEFARIIVKIVQSELPSFTTIERQVNKRRGKMYLDFLQNRPQATLATTYSVRPKPKASVSTPLYWEELKKGLKIQDFTIRNVPARLQKEGDIFKPVLGKGINMLKALDRLNKQWEAIQ